MLTAKFVHRDASGKFGTVLFLSEIVRVDFAPGASPHLRPGDEIGIGNPGEKSDMIQATLQEAVDPKLFCPDPG